MASVPVYIVLMIITFDWQMRFLNAFAKVNDACQWYQVKPNVKFPECHLQEDDYRLTCFGGMDEQWTSKAKIVHTLDLCEWPDQSFNPQQILEKFLSIRNLTIANSNLSTILGTFPAGCRYLEVVNITNTKLSSVPNDAFTKLPSLRVIDLRNNALPQLNQEAFNVSLLQRVYLSGNPLKCSEETGWILISTNQSLASKIVDKDSLKCAAPYQGRPLVPVVEIIMTLREECKKTVCDCELVYVITRGGRQTHRQLMPFTSVNCSHRDLTAMPEFLPENTTTLRLAGNKISDLAPLTTNPAYKGVLDLYLDDNQVESIVQLDGSYWLDHFRIISLRNNKLSDLPTYALENVLIQSSTASSLYLGNNPWTCDCHFTPGFQDLLIRYPNVVKDINDVRCAVVADDENSNKQIRDLTRTEICINPDEEPLLYPLDILNIVLASLIFLVLGKLLYDYWSFKKTGRLPWIVAKIP